MCTKELQEGEIMKYSDFRSFKKIFKEKRKAGIRLGSFFMMLIIVFSAFCFVLPTDKEDVNAVVISDVTDKGYGYSAVLYDSSNGLPTSEANAIVQSDDGFIWIGNYSGLVRYNGSEFYRYDSSTGISSVVSLYYDSKKRLWVGTNDNGIAVLEGDKFTFFNHTHGLSSSSVRDITEDNEGNILAATTMGISYIDNDMKLHNINEPQINKEYILSLERDSRGTVYGITMSGGFFTIQNKRISSFYNSKELKYGNPNSIYPDPNNNGYVYIGTDESELIHFKLGNTLSDIKVYSVAPHKTINDISLIKENLWICTDKGIGYFDKDFKYHQLDTLPMENSVDKIMLDHESNLWFCSSRQGVMKIVENAFVDISKLAGMDPTVVNSVCSYEDQIYIATDRGLVIYNSNYKRINNKLTSLMNGIRIRCLKKDTDNNIWVCSYSNHGLLRYDPKTDKLTSFNQNTGLVSNRVRMICLLSNGNVAVATSMGMNIISGDKVIKTYNKENGISNQEILCIEEGKDGKLFLGSDGDGMYVVKGDNVSRIGIKDGLTSEVILRVKKDPEKNIFWIITSNSISYMDDNLEIKNISKFPYSNNFDMFFDNQERVWILSSNGIYVVNKNILLADEKIDYTLYDIKCGLPFTATANSYSYKDEDGTLFISGTSGVCTINIDNEKATDSDVRLAVSYVTADDSYIEVGSNNEIHIPSSCKRLHIEPNAFTYSLNNPHLSYQLEGFDDKPVEVSKQEMDLSQLNYTNLRGGEYTFKLSLINTMTGKPEKTIRLRIIKDKALYEHWWFGTVLVLLSVMIVVFFVILYFRRKTAVLLRKQEENKTYIYDLTKLCARFVDMKDKYTNGHSFRVAKYTSMFAKKLGKSQEEVDEIYNIALLHDIGKISIPDNILNKPGRLTDEEFAVMKTHPQTGYDILKEITIAPQLALGAGYHHERIDGKGYPAGLKGDEIPEIAQIIAVADAFDAMYSTRPYRKKMKLEAAKAEIERCSGTQFNPRVVKVFLELADEGAFETEDFAYVPTEEELKTAEEMKKKADEKKQSNKKNNEKNNDTQKKDPEK